jgi:hypothetical protein
VPKRYWMWTFPMPEREPHPDECRCQDDKGNVNFDPACPFHGDNGTMIARWPNRKDPYA